MKIYIVIRETEDSEFNSIQAFYSAHLSKDEAEKAVEKYRELPVEPNYVILEKEIS